jgi:endonuclease/exonuclease/phosphatase family metal-dependent hydrolase
MSYNLYQGAELTPIVLAQGLSQIPAAVSSVWSAVQASNIPQRAEKIAQEIADARPDLVGLQEAALWRIQTPGTAFTANPQPAAQVVYDFVDLLIKDLAARGRHYAAVAISPSFDGQLPDATGDDIRLTDRVVILARTDLPRSEQLHISNVQTQRFATNVTLPLGGPGGPAFTVYNSWASVDVTRHDQTFRFVTFHLDGNVPAVNVAEADELLAGPGHTLLPVIFAGDTNSPADGSGPLGYSALVQGGLADAWLQTHPFDSGYTWGQAEDLRNVQSSLTQRIDYVLSQGNVQALAMKVVGASPNDKTASGLWPSDHAGIVATLQILPQATEQHEEAGAGSGKGKTPSSLVDAAFALLS